MPKPMNATHVMCERAWRCHRSGNAPGICPKRSTYRSRWVKPV